MIVIHSLGGGGAERVACDMSAWWTAAGYEVSVVTQADAHNDAYELASGVKRHVVGLAASSGGAYAAVLANIKRVLRLRRLIRKERPSIVIGMMTTSSILAVLAGHNLGCRVIATEHGHPPVQDLPRSWQRLRQWAYPRAWAVVALTSGSAQWLQNHIPGSRIEVIPNAIRWPLPAAQPTVTPPARGKRYRLLAVGRLHPVKGFDRLIAAFALLADHFPDWDLCIVGEGALRDALEAQISTLGLDQRISLPGRVGNIADWYEHSDLYVLSSRSEGLSNTLLEAMAAGLPVVAVDCDSGPREVIRQGIDGILVQPADDIEALAAYLSDVMAHPEKRAALARRAPDVRDRFSMPRIMGLWEKLVT